MAEVDQDQKICDDLLVEIFMRLPIKSVFKFKCLSNTWNHLLSNQPFRNQYESLRKKSKTLLPLLGFFRGFNMFLNPKIRARVCFIPTCLESMSVRSGEFIKKIGFCFAISNGVILCGHGFHTYFVCNPVTDTWRKLPPAQNPQINHWGYGSVGFSYEEEDNGFRFTVVRVDCSLKYKNKGIEIDTYCSDKRYWEKYMLCVADYIYLHKCFGCQVVGSTFFWTGMSRYNGLVLVAYNYKLGQIEGKMGAWLIQFEAETPDGSHVLGESTQGRLICAVNKISSINFYTLKRNLECYSYNTVVPYSEWVQIIKLNIIQEIGSLPTPLVIEIHPQNSRFVLMKSGTTIYWYDVELRESRSIWHLRLPPSANYFDHLMPFYKSRHWPPLLR